MQSVSSRIWTRVTCPIPTTMTITPRAPPKISEIRYGKRTFWKLCDKYLHLSLSFSLSLHLHYHQLPFWVKWSTRAFFNFFHEHGNCVCLCHVTPKKVLYLMFIYFLGSVPNMIVISWSPFYWLFTSFLILSSIYVSCRLPFWLFNNFSCNINRRFSFFHSLELFQDLCFPFISLYYFELLFLVILSISIFLNLLLYLIFYNLYIFCVL